MTVSKQIIEVLDALCNKFGIVIDWTSQNIVPYIETLCKKFITFEIATSIMYIVLFVVLFIISCIVAKCWSRKAAAVRWDCDRVEGIVGIISIAIAVALGITCVAGVPMQIHDIIEAVTFPEKTIIEYIKMLIDSK